MSISTDLKRHPEDGLDCTVDGRAQNEVIFYFGSKAAYEKWRTKYRITDKGIKVVSDKDGKVALTYKLKKVPFIEEGRLPKDSTDIARKIHKDQMYLTGVRPKS